MTRSAKLLAAAAVLGAAAAPAAAQYYSQPYPYPQQTYPQGQPYPYPQQQPYQQPYGQAYPGYGYPQGYTGNPATDIIDQLLGNNYSVTDRQAVRQCARAAQTRAQTQYGGYAYGQPGYRQNIAVPSMHVTAITEVSRRSNGLRVRGLMSSGYAGQYGQYGQYGGQYGNRYGYPNQAYATGDVTFRCNVDYRGVVTDVRIGRNEVYRRY